MRPGDHDVQPPAVHSTFSIFSLLSHCTTILQPSMYAEHEGPFRLQVATTAS